MRMTRPNANELLELCEMHSAASIQDGTNYDMYLCVSRSGRTGAIIESRNYKLTIFDPALDGTGLRRIYEYDYWRDQLTHKYTFRYRLQPGGIWCITYAFGVAVVPSNTAKFAVFTKSGRMIAGSESPTEDGAKTEACWILGFDPITLFIECGYTVKQIR